jgi:hypothetical protein
VPTPKVVGRARPTRSRWQTDSTSANAGAALDEVLRSRRRHIEYVVVTECVTVGDGPTPTALLPPPSQAQQEAALKRTRRSARWDDVRNRRAAGYGIARIAREMGMHRRTVRRYLATPVPPRNRPAEHPKPSGLTSPTLQPFVEYLQRRWQAGARTSPNSSASWRRKVTRAAIHCSCNHSSRGEVRVRRQNLAAGCGVAGHVSSA